MEETTGKEEELQKFLGKVDEIGKQRFRLMCDWHFTAIQESSDNDRMSENVSFQEGVLTGLYLMVSSNHIEILILRENKAMCLSLLKNSLGILLWMFSYIDD